MFHIIKLEYNDRYCIYHKTKMSSYNEPTIKETIAAYYKHNFNPSIYNIWKLKENKLFDDTGLFGTSIAKVNSLEDIEISYPELFV